ncbi:MAG TPA: cupin domain-containing protein [candidate division Zixibacteria bacterium]|nr:cupin domain-containing protein [candidate division Zixibacteria bacterium]
MKPSPKNIRCDLNCLERQRILGGPPETVSICSGLVIITPGETVGEHSTNNREEIIVTLEGEGRMIIENSEPLDLRFGTLAYVPPETTHDVVNTGESLLKYIYVVARTV